MSASAEQLQEWMGRACGLAKEAGQLFVAARRDGYVATCKLEHKRLCSIAPSLIFSLLIPPSPSSLPAPPPGQRFDINTKEGIDLVTEVDKASEKLIIGGLNER